MPAMQLPANSLEEQALSRISANASTAVSVSDGIAVPVSGFWEISLKPSSASHFGWEFIDWAHLRSTSANFTLLNGLVPVVLTPRHTLDCATSWTDSHIAVMPVNAHAFTNASLGICVCNPGRPAALHWTGELAGAWRETLLTGYYALYDKVKGTTGGAELIGTVEHHAFNLALVFMIGLVFHLVPMLSRLISV